MLRLGLLLMTIASATAAQAAPVVLQVVGADGRPLSDAVVVLTMAGTPAPPPLGPYDMAQRNITFEPHLLIVPVGATVRFPNRDKVRHHVYSFSRTKKFDLKLYGKDETRSVTFDKPGPVTLGCNIHDQMSGVIYVTSSPYTAETDGQGRVRFSTDHAGPARITVWHPSIRAVDNQLTNDIAVAPAGYAGTVAVRR